MLARLHALSSLSRTTGRLATMRRFASPRLVTANSNTWAGLSTTASAHRAGWLSATFIAQQKSPSVTASAVPELEPDYEIRRHDCLSASAPGSKSNNDWMDVLDDAAEAQEAIRAFKEDGLVLGLSNRDGQFNIMESDADADADADAINCSGISKSS